MDMESRIESEERIGITMEDRSVRTRKDLKDAEINKAMSKMKIKKAGSMDEIPREVWKFAEDSVKKGLIEIIRRVWKEGDIPSDWRRNIVILLYKRGDKEKTGKYRGISCCVQLISSLQK